MGTKTTQRKEKRQSMIDRANDRLGKTSTNRLGSKMWITRYGGSTDIDVQFENGYFVKGTQYNNFIKGAMNNPYDISVYGHGYIGVGNFRVSTKGKHSIEYIAWKSMLNRCYGKNYHKNSPTYVGCEVDEKWLNFQNFAKWFQHNYYSLENSRMELDKDIIKKGNRVYSEDLCVFVPQEINRILTKTNANRGSLPIGVEKRGNKYTATCCNGNKKQVYLGSFDSSDEAFIAYKSYKENLLSDIADSYKDRIPNILYRSLKDYEVDIND